MLLRPASLVFLSLALPLAAQTPAAPVVRTWTPVYDSIGSAPRVMSPGYTLWQDSVTGWMLKSERIIKLTMPDPAGGRQPLPQVTTDWDRMLWRTLLLDDGRVIVSRGNPTSIELYDTTGNFVRNIGKLGGGDSTYLAATGLVMYHDTVVVHDGLQGAIRFYTLEGRFIRGFPTRIYGTAPSLTIDPRGLLRIDESRQPAPVQLGRGDTTQLAIQQAFDDAFRRGAQWRWVYFSMLGLRVDSLVAPPPVPPRQWIGLTPAVSDTTVRTIPPLPRVPYGGMAMLTVPYTHKLSGTFLKDGTLVSGYTNRFEFVNSRRGQDTIRVFGRTNVTPVLLTRPFIDSMIQTQVEHGMPAALVKVVKAEDFPAAYPAWNDVVADEKGYLWVASGTFAQRNHYFSVFSPNGLYLGFVHSLFEKFDTASWANGRVAVVLTADRRPIIHIYRVDRRGM